MIEGAALPQEARERAGLGVLRVVRVGERSVVHTARASSPLRLLTPRNHGHAAWVFVTNLGGGLVDGDAIDLRVDVGPDAALLLGTQASTKVYRSPRGCRVAVSARIARGGLLALLSDPVVCFEGARYTQLVDVEIEEGGSLVLADCLNSGRLARGERWAFSRYASRTRVTRDGRAVLHDALVLDPAHGAIPARMGRFECVATVAAFGPATAAVREAVEAAAKHPVRGEARVQTSAPVGSDGIVGRVVAEKPAEALAVVRALVSPIAASLGDDVFARKW